MRGFTLLEVLIVMLVAALGLLGLAALALTDTRHAANSQWRTQAVLLADEMAERIRANSYWATNASGALVASPTYASDCSASLPVSALTFSSAGVQLASTGNASDWRNFDLAEMCAKVVDPSQGGLPGGTLAIAATQDASHGFYYTVTIGWQMRLSSAGVQAASYTTLMRP
jgi:type IV pilus assembly protein PilV